MIFIVTFIFVIIHALISGIVEKNKLNWKLPSLFYHTTKHIITFGMIAYALYYEIVFPTDYTNLAIGYCFINLGVFNIFRNLTYGTEWYTLGKSSIVDRVLTWLTKGWRSVLALIYFCSFCVSLGILYFNW